MSVDYSHAEPGEYTCRTCRQPLSIFVSGGRKTPVHCRKEDHEPDPVHADELAPIMACDFCGSIDTVAVFAERAGLDMAIRETAVVGEYRDRLGDAHEAVTKRRVAIGAELVHRHNSDWASCRPCADLVTRLDSARLARRAMTRRGLTRGLSQMRKWMQDVLRSIDPRPLPLRVSPLAPYWPDDPMIPPGVHKLALLGEHDAHTSACRCGGYRNDRRGDASAHFESFDEHMRDVQRALRSTSTGTDGQGGLSC